MIQNLKKLQFLILALFCLPQLALADFNFVSNGMLQPDEIVMPDPMLMNVGPTIEWMTSTTGNIVEFTTNDIPVDTLMTLPPMMGMPPRVAAQDGSFSSIIVEPQDSNVFFSELEFNVARVMGAPNPTFSVTVIDQFGNSFVSDFDDDVLNPGPNFFGISGTGGSLIAQAMLTASSTDIRDIRQIRATVSVVPEPSATLIMTWLLGAVAWRRR